MRITEDAIDGLGNEELQKAVENARSEGRETVRAEDF